MKKYLTSSLIFLSLLLSACSALAPEPNNPVILEAPPTLSGALTQTIEDEPTSLPLIINVIDLLGSPVGNIEAILGSPINIFPIALGEEVGNTIGGESRDYQFGKYFIFIDYDKSGIAQLFQIIEGLEEDNYHLNDYPVILQRLGIPTITPPSLVAPARYEWSNYYGYTINIAQNGSLADSIVWTVQIYISPQ